MRTEFAPYFFFFFFNFEPTERNENDTIESKHDLNGNNH